MKILTVLLLLATINCTAFSQIEVKQSDKRNTVGKVRSGSSLIAELSYNSDGADTTYFLMFNNAEYKTLNDYQSISFAEDGGVANKFHEILKSFFSDENKKNKDYKVDIKLGETAVSMVNMRMMGITSVMVHCPKGYFMLSEKQVDRLFGK